MSRPSRHKSRYDTMSFFENDGSVDYPAGDFKDFKMDGPDITDDMDDLNALGRKESRIPVAIRRLRTRGDRTNASMGEEGSRTAAHSSPRGDHSSQADFWNAHGERERAPRHHDDRHAESNNGAIVASEANLPVAIKGEELHEHKHVCPHCSRTFAVVSREGVYVAFSIGLVPLMILLLAIVILLMIPYLGPTIGPWCNFKKVNALPPPPHTSKDGVLSKWWKK